MLTPNTGFAGVAARRATLVLSQRGAQDRGIEFGRMIENRSSSALSGRNMPMSETTQAPPLPDRLSTDPRSPHHIASVFEHEVGIRLNEKERFDVAEYCISEGWVKVPAGKTRDRKGQPLMIKLKGKVYAFYR
jgi:hypothetical protein